MLIDTHNRTIDYVRFAVTQACNLRCTYCMREDHAEHLQTHRQLDTEGIGSVIGALGELGIRKIRFTGGEPLIRGDIDELVRRAKSAPGIDTVKLTTNGVLLEKNLGGLIDAGLDGINLSLDTLDPEKFRSITRRDEFASVNRALQSLLATPSLTLKINMLLLRGINNDEIPAFAELTREHAVTVRFMELQPFDEQQIWRTGRFMGADMIREQLYHACPGLQPVTGLSTEHYSFRIPGHKGSLAIIPAYSRNFCNQCSKLRITADGRIISCLYRQENIELLPLLAGKADHEAIKKSILSAVRQKPKDGLKSRTDNAGTSMSEIGG